MMVWKIKKKKKKKKKKFFFFFFFVFSHPEGSISLTGVRESGSISGRLPDDPEGFTCMIVGYKYGIMGYISIYNNKDFSSLKNDLFVFQLA